MMMIRSQENPRNKSFGISDDHIIPTSICPTWKLYENPFYNLQNQPHNPTIPHQEETNHTPLKSHNNKQIHRLNLPISARKIAASFWDLTFIRPFMDSELEMARAQIAELKSKLEHERKARKKLESMNKKIARELSEERKGREALERVCEELANHISMDREEINRLRKEMEEERKMLRMAEVMREERVQMKLNDAKYLLEEKLLELEETKKMLPSNAKTEAKNQEDMNHNISSAACDQRTEKRCEIADHKSICNSASEGNSASFNYQLTFHRRNQSPEPENPHIKRGIKGFVEFPKVVRAISSKSRHWGTKLECQKAQLRILLKQKCPIRSNGLITS
ncbi:protein BRANCHLESS TRICHOME-like [Nicotiana tabacum]|uniref:Protein BRANCHLESS TRICHOME-like n=1 Tax=Nicotiana tabacum TaxID=4097 RepID=A0A1S4CW88_TOBAC|nr:PREDICTED: protein BRANCHLESS TRICHOME-like [Nicotiana tabacum]